MKNGTYLVSFPIDLHNCSNKEEAQLLVAGWIMDAIDDDAFPILDFELTEEEDIEYTSEGPEVPEVSF